MWRYGFNGNWFYQSPQNQFPLKPYLHILPSHIEIVLISELVMHQVFKQFQYGWVVCGGMVLMGIGFGGIGLITPGTVFVLA
jgi:hypothetical protein